MITLISVLGGAVSMASLVASLFFLRFWVRTHDTFFLLFAIAFAIDAVTRFTLACAQMSDEAEPLYYIPRVISFGFIILAVIQKNRPGRSR